jgi:hypothetical protein
MMAKRKGQQTGRVVINVTPEQERAVALMVSETFIKYGVNKNDALVGLLAAACNSYGIEWPEHIKQPGKRNDLTP